MKITKVTVVDNDKEFELEVLDATMLAICAGNVEGETQVLSQVTTNAVINLELLKKLVAPTVVSENKED